MGLTDQSDQNASSKSIHVYVETVPGELGVEVNHTVLQPASGVLPCWVYLTNGFSRLNQPELVFLLRRKQIEAVENFPQAPIEIFRDLYNLAKRGSPITAGGRTQFNGLGMFGLRHHLVYLPAQVIPDIQTPPGALIARMVTDEELALSSQYGLLRLMALLGHAHRYFPCPPWSDRDLPNLPSLGTYQNSFLNEVPHTALFSMRVVARGSEILIQNSARTAETIRKVFASTDVPDTQPVAFTTGLDPQSDGCFAWNPEDPNQPTAIGPQGSQLKNISACFIAFFPDQKQEGVKYVEDGFVLMLKNKNWKMIRKTLSEGGSIRVTLQETGITISQY